MQRDEMHIPDSWNRVAEELAAKTGITPNDASAMMIEAVRAYSMPKTPLLTRKVFGTVRPLRKGQRRGNTV